MTDRGAWSTTVVPAAVAELAEPRDRAFASHLAYELVRWAPTLDELLRPVCDRPLDDVEAPVRWVLRLGALQLWRAGVPDHAAVATSVRLVRELVPSGRARGAAGFVNGVLRALARSLAAGGPRWPGDEIARLAATTAHPAWVVEDLVARLGSERAAAVLAADNEPPGPTLRATVDRDELLAELAAAGVEAAPGALAPEAVRIRGADPRALAAVREGRARPQDEASMLVVHAAEVAPGDRVLDLCAGPGGKATHLAALAGPEGEVVAIELHEHRAAAVRRAAETLGVRVDVRTGDALDPPLEDDDGFDVVLLDAPCTGLGTGRRRPEVRWRRSPDDVAALATLQRRLLRAGATRVRPGGRLVYAVCTWTGAETDEVIAAAPDSLELRSTAQLLPDLEDTDGMFVAVFDRLEGETPSEGRRGGPVAG